MKLFFISLGCDKNLVDSEKMLRELKDSGIEITEDEYQADICIVNTCCFIGDAKQESIETLLTMAGLKKTARLKVLIAAGCLAQRYKDEILKEIPEVDGVLGTFNCERIVTLLNSCIKADDGLKVITDEVYRESQYRRRLKSDLEHYSYLKIAEGCDKRCTYCIIPYVRGRYRSFPIEDLVKEAEELAGNGVNELILIAQETTIYGTDLYGHKAIAELIHELAAIDGISWIRLMYCYPEEVSDELIECFKQEKKLVRYIDLPIQHISDPVLKRMGRRTTGKDIRNIIFKLKKELPDLIIRTSLISGFPGETEEEFEELLSFVKEGCLDRVGVFTFSREEGTPAYAMKPQIRKNIREQRRKKLMLAQQEIVFDKNSSMNGRELTVCIDGYLPDEGVYIGRSYMDAPGIDGCIFLKCDRELITGTFVTATISGARGYDLLGSC
ncbi:MAG: 30S ribosomal protein S12 methylthiotransferase RimO [Lachnospiraceae bacterium]|nr:30S ribosomal protein S12 methylthiotransferase RimO [Lachnospiraceae bacterium]